MKKKLVLLSFIMVILVAISIPVWGADRQYKIAVLPFDDGSIQDRWWGGWEVGKGVSDELVTALLNTHQFRLIEREQINKILKEQNFGASGRVDPQSAAKLGKILGVQLLVLGRVTEFSIKSGGGSLLTNTGFGLGIKTSNAIVAIDARLVDTTTAEIMASVTGRGEKKNTNLSLAVNWNSIGFGSSEFQKTNLGIALRDAVGQVANGLAANAYANGGPSGASSSTSAISGVVFYARDNRVIINIGTTDGVRPGMVFTVQHVIDQVKDPDSGEIVDEITEPIAEISVTEVKEKTSTCIVANLFNTPYPITVKDKVVLKF